MTGSVKGPGWIALSDREGLIAPCDSGPLLARGALVIEVALPLPRRAVLLDWRRMQGWERALSVFADAEAGITLLHRQGRAQARHRIAGPLDLGDGGLLRLTLSWDAPRRVWQMSAEQPGRGAAPAVRQGRDPLPMAAADIAALCAPGGPDLRHLAVQWFGIASDAAVLAGDAPWVGPRTPVATPGGAVAAEALAPGCVVLTDRGPATVTQADRADRPGRGSQAPVLLRAPFFGDADLLVSAGTALALSGPEVEYLTGDEGALVEARHLCDGLAALPDTRRPVVSGIALRLDRPGLLLSGGCRLLPGGTAPEGLRRLSAAEAVSLMGLLGRGGQVRAA